MTTLGSIDAQDAINVRQLSALVVDGMLAAGFDPGRPTALLGIPMHRSPGDSMITSGEFHLLAKLQANPPRVCGSYLDPVPDLLARTPHNANILLQGGGDLGDLWPRPHDFRLAITELAPSSSHVIWLPQSVHFSSPDSDAARSTRDTVHRRRPVVLLRDTQSIARWEALFDYPATLCPDLGMIAPIPRARVRRDGDPQSATGTRHLIRRDIESTHPMDVPGSVDWADTPMLSWPVQRYRGAMWRLARRKPSNLLRRRGPEATYFRHLAALTVLTGVHLLGPSPHLVTDRLHGAILGLRLGKRVDAYDNSYGKVSAVFGTWSRFITEGSLTVH